MRILRASLVAGLAAVLISASAPNAAKRPNTVVTVLVPGQSHGEILRRVNGIDWNPADGKLYATSTTSEAIYRIDTKTGDVDMAIGPPWGEGDDLAFSQSGAVAWTAIATGELRYKAPGGDVQVLDKTVPGINPVAFSKDGRLVAAQANEGHVLYQFDPTGKKPRRVIMKDMPDLNSFAFGPDGILYSPQRGGKTVAIDIDAGNLRVVNEDNGGSVKVDARGQLIEISKSGNLVRTDPKTGQSQLIAPIGEGTDGLAVGPDGTIYASSPAESSIFAFDPVTGAKREIVRGHFSSLGGLAIAAVNGKDVLFAADAWGFRNVDPTTGEITKPKGRGLRSGGSSDLAFSDTAIALANVRLGVVQKLDRASEKLVFENKEIKQPYGVALLDDGSVAVADFVGRRIARVDANGVSTLAEGFQGPVGISRGPQGALLITDSPAGTLTRIDPKTGKRDQVANGLSRPEGVAVMADGRIAVAETGANRLVAIDLKTKKREVLAERLPFGAHVTATAENVGLPAGVAVAGNGDIYVSCDGDFSIRKVSLRRN